MFSFTFSSSYNLSWLVGSAKLDVDLLCLQPSVVEIKGWLAVNEVVLHGPCQLQVSWLPLILGQELGGSFCGSFGFVVAIWEALSQWDVLGLKIVVFLPVLRLVSGEELLQGFNLFLICSSLFLNIFWLGVECAQTVPILKWDHLGPQDEILHARFNLSLLSELWVCGRHPFSG